MANFGKLNFAVAFNPQTAFPLDARYYFDTLVAAQEAAAGAVEVGSATGTYFYGQTVVVVESSVATLYVIQPDKSLKPVGSTPLGDDKSIAIVDGKVQLYGFDTAQTGQQPRVGVDGNLEWYTPNTDTVEGLQQAVGQLQSDVEQIQTDIGGINTELDSKANSADVYTKAQTDEKIAATIGSVYKPAGSVAFAQLPSVLSASELGNVYNVTDAFEADERFMAGEVGTSYPAGTNVAVVEVDSSYYFDALSGFVDLTGYLTITEAEETYATIASLTSGLQGKVDKVKGSSLVQDTLITKLNSLLNISSVTEGELAVTPEGELGVVAIAQSKVTGLTEALADKVDVVPGKGLSTNDYTNEDKSKLDGIVTGAQVNILEVVKINNEALPISEKAVNIPIATAQALGVVKGSTDENKVSVGVDGTMEVNSLNVNKLTQTSGDTLILNGGNSTIASA